jgi:microcystin-dependent protein
MAIDRITTGAVLDGAIQTSDIATGAVDNDRLAVNAVTAEKMAPGAAFVTGMVMPYAGVIDNQGQAPSGWLLCDGSEQDASTYASLKNLLQTTYGAYTNGSGGTGTTHFRLPDLRGKVIAALDNMGGGSANKITSPEGDQLGNVLGTEEHTLTAAQSGLPGHTVSSTLNITTATARQILSGSSGSGGFQANASNNYINRSWVNIEGTASGTVTAADASAAHPLLQPTMFMNYIIKT